ncbi:hypothetical protein H2509_13470 [Stappia sp. F7233]|uniref:Uncharacterized protein n=1 Tax=Stappia albiluteola TaxID=2758565 RepID=A0A839ACN3_9HYPH|nr:hypothetical protein [Stappia albiluteola]MBA5777462.1 hypothetical protein [Stappia albiluteola]MBA5777500.1 hypothetical protein [Stappia albiluteola]MBA5778089.1 hypothetical protein [Stappia albiluteola]MBA5778134.1 hypothetical protein [Stappia albiluteola]
MKEGYRDYLERHGRLVILEAIAREFNGHLREDLIQKALDVYLVSRSIEWVRTQLRKLEEIGAVNLEEDGGKLIAGLAQAGRDHLERRAPLDGVAWPEDGR